jgi:FkbM family methyltransferase
VVELTIDDGRDGPSTFTCADSLESRITCRAILDGRTYPDLPFIGAVDVVLDVGANCGATSVHLARLHPGARIHAVEPGGEAGALLEGNVAAYPGVTVHRVGLGDRDEEVLLHLDPDDIGRSSTVGGGDGPTERITLRHAGRWAAENGIERIDILKVDVEGLEVEVLTALAPLLPAVKVLYVEYDDRRARRAIDALLAPTHELYFAALVALDQGEITYLRADLADHPDAQPHLRDMFLRAVDGAS